MEEVKRFPFPWAFVALTVVVGLVSACNHTGPRLAIAMGDKLHQWRRCREFYQW